MKDWMNDLPDDLKASETLDQYDSPEAALQGLVDTKAMLGNSLRIPGDDADDGARTDFVDKLLERVPSVMLKPDLEDEEQSDNFYKLMGVPDAPDKYVMPEKLNISEEQEINMRAQAHLMKMTREQFKLAVTRLSEANTTMAEQHETNTSDAMSKLRGEWGAAFEERMALAKKLHETNFAGTGVAFENLDPAALPGLYTTAKALMGSDKQFAEQPTGETPLLSPQEARLQISEIESNKDHPYWDPAAPGHQAAMDKVLKLEAAAAGRADEEFMKPISR